MTRLRAACYACAVVASALWVVSSSGQTTQPNQPPPQPTFRTEANYVRVDVYPTKDGAPIADLTAEDFEVLENNAPQKIEQFERVVVRAAGPQETRIEPNTVRRVAVHGGESARAPVRAVPRHRITSTSAARTISASRWSTRSIASSARTIWWR